jgi:multidrug efflux pump subunit AcrB
MKFMNKRTFNNEMNVANAQGEVRETRALNWTYISLGLIILAFISVILAMTFFPNNILPNRDQPDNTAGRPQSP